MDELDDKNPIHPLGWLVGGFGGALIFVLMDGPSYEPWYIPVLVGGIAGLWMAVIASALVRGHIGWAAGTLFIPIVGVGYPIWFLGQIERQKSSTAARSPATIATSSSASSAGLLSPPATRTAEDSSPSDLRELARLHQEGVIDDAEFTAAKKRILGI